MGKDIQIPITGPSYKNPILPANNQRCVNWYPTSAGPSNPLEVNNPMMKGRGFGPLIRTMGTKFLGNIGTGVCRAMYSFKSDIDTYIILMVVGNSVYKVTFDPTTLAVTTSALTGTLSTSTGTVTISHNSTQVVFSYSTGISGSKDAAVWLYKTNNTLSSLNAVSNFVGGTHMVMIDGYFIVNNPASTQVQSSALNNVSTWAGTDVANMNSKPDVLIALGQSKTELWGFGLNHIEVWYDAANAVGFPFSKRVGSDLDIGCIAPYSVQSVNGSLIWLDSRRFLAQSDFSQFFRNQSSGYQITKLSDEAIDAEWATYADVTDAIGSTYVDKGHVMYEITFPTANKTWVYDTTMNMWHERAYFNQLTGTYSASRTNYYCQVDNYVLGGCLNNNALYVLSRDLLSDSGEAIHRIRTTQYFNENFKELTVNYLEIRATTGLQPSDLNAGTQNIYTTTVASFNTTSTISGSVRALTVPEAIFNPGAPSWMQTQLITVNPDGTSTWFVQTGVGGQPMPVGFINSWIAISFPLGTDSFSLSTERRVILGQVTAVGTYLGQDSFTVAGDFSSWFNVFGTNPVPAKFVIDLFVFVYFSPPISDPTVSISAFVTFAISTGATFLSQLPGTSAINGASGLCWRVSTLTGLGEAIKTGTPFSVPTTLTYVSSIILTSTDPIYIGDLLLVTLDDTTIKTLRVINIVGNEIFFITNDPQIDSTNLTAGNLVTLQRVLTTTTLFVNAPHIVLRYSKDAGYTWSYGLTRSLGKTGEFNKRIRWTRLGSMREWLIECKITEVCDVSLVDASANVDLESY